MMASMWVKSRCLKKALSKLATSRGRSDGLETGEGFLGGLAQGGVGAAGGFSEVLLGECVFPFDGVLIAEVEVGLREVGL